jgi:alkylation response protein AidB-like acyl-CoA dehydrogenase
MELLISEEYGGSGSSFMDLFVLFEEMGRACLMASFFSTAVCTYLLLDMGNEHQKKKFMPSVANGELILALALIKRSARYDASGIATNCLLEAGDHEEAVRAFLEKREPIFEGR